MKGIDYTTFSKAFDRYYSRLVAYASHYTGNRTEAADIVQDSFAGIWEKRERYPDYEIGNLLYKVVRNKCLDFLKHKAVANAFELDAFDGLVDFERLYNYDFYGSEANPILYSELVRIIRKEVAKLPSRNREVFVLSRFENLSNHEIALKLGLSDAAVHKHISKAIEKLSKALG